MRLKNSKWKKWAPVESGGARMGQKTHFHWRWTLIALTSSEFVTFLSASAAFPLLHQQVSINRYWRKQMVALCCQCHSFSFISPLLLPLPFFFHIFSIAVIKVDHCNNWGWPQLEGLAFSTRNSKVQHVFLHLPNFTVILNCPQWSGNW